MALSAGPAWPLAGQLSATRARFLFELVPGCSMRKAHLPPQPRSSGTPGQFSHRPDPAQRFSGPRATTSSAFGRWKVFQLCFTIPAVHTALVLGAEPKTTATFANFQMNTHFHSGFSIEQTPAGPSRCIACGGATRNSWKARFLMTCLGDGSLCSQLACKYFRHHAIREKSAIARPWERRSRLRKHGTTAPGARRAPAFHVRRPRLDGLTPPHTSAGEESRLLQDQGIPM